MPVQCIRVCRVCMQVTENALSLKSPFGSCLALSLRKRASCSTANQMGDAANAHQRNIYNKKIPTLEYVDGQVR